MPSHFKGSEEQVRALSAFINLARGSDSLMRRLAAKLEPLEVTLGQFAVLEALYHLGPMCQKTLGEKLLRSGGNITLVVNNLTKQGWVRRQQQADDHRMMQIHLTPRGRALIARVVPQHVEAIVKEMSALDPEEQEALRRICRKLGKGGEELCQERMTKEQAKKEKEYAGNSTE